MNENIAFFILWCLFAVLLLYVLVSPFVFLRQCWQTQGQLRAHWHAFTRGGRIGVLIGTAAVWYAATPLVRTLLLTAAHDGEFNPLIGTLKIKCFLGLGAILLIGLIFTLWRGRFALNVAAAYAVLTGVFWAFIAAWLPEPPILWFWWQPYLAHAGLLNEQTAQALNVPRYGGSSLIALCILIFLAAVYGSLLRLLLRNKKHFARKRQLSS